MLASGHTYVLGRLDLVPLGVEPMPVMWVGVPRLHMDVVVADSRSVSYPMCRPTPHLFVRWRVDFAITL
jgi:hypothetical protein